MYIFICLFNKSKKKIPMLLSRYLGFPSNFDTKFITFCGYDAYFQRDRLSTACLNSVIGNNSIEMLYFGFRGRPYIAKMYLDFTRYTSIPTLFIQLLGDTSQFEFKFLYDFGRYLMGYNFHISQ